MKAKILTAMASLILVAAAFTACGTKADSNGRNPKASESVGSNSDKNDTNQPENKSGLTSLNNFTANTLDGKEYTADNFSDADVTVINIWSTTCGPCIDEMPDIAEFTKTLPDNVKLITWCLDGDYDASYAKQVLSGSKYEGVTLTSGNGDMEKLNQEIMYTPTTIFVDGKGNIIGEALIGGSESLEKDYTEKINEALKALGKEAMK